jgi:hypothetical protein
MRNHQVAPIDCLYIFNGAKQSFPHYIDYYTHKGKLHFPLMPCPYVLGNSANITNWIYNYVNSKDAQPHREGVEKPSAAGSPRRETWRQQCLRNISMRF